MNSCALRAAISRVNGITTSSSTPSEAISSALTAGVVSSFGVCSGATTETGCGSNVSTLSEPSITLRWPRCTPSKVPTASARGRRSASGKLVTFTPPQPIWARPRLPRSMVDQRRRAPFLAPPRRGAGILDREWPDRGSPQLLAVGVAEICDERAHVGARGALDQELRSLALAPALLEAVDGDDALRHLEALAAPRALVGALAPHLDGGVDRRPLAHLARAGARGSAAACDRCARSRPRGRPSSIALRAARSPRSAWAAPSASTAQRVAVPTSKSRSPLANGSSVPAWPVLTPPSARRTAATTSCEVMPTGLSTSSTPSMGLLGERLRGVQLRRDLRAQEGDQLVHGAATSRSPRRGGGHRRPGPARSATRRRRRRWRAATPCARRGARGRPARARAPRPSCPARPAGGR